MSSKTYAFIPPKHSFYKSIVILSVNYFSGFVSPEQLNIVVEVC
ncbi:hypothetical protein HMPREF9151_02456 [Hoylesella saccharolytica F0055]|uniref:Uncharacterized protein n=1 Tax=Hoylesella saccharolytica F0055 TaxID=1127699 RepID=L1MYX5_9BACT|nr:hypothetical protein HMPREF9151_02456 [Hoylesella saccharolytica F0055]